MIGFILIVTVLLGGFAIARSVKDKAADRNEANINAGDNTSSQNTFGIPGGYSIDDTGDCTTDGVDNISISATSSEIKIQTHQSDRVEARFYGTVFTLSEDMLPHLQINKSGKTISVKVVYPNVMNISISGKTNLEVTIPEGWENDLEITSNSGTISAPALSGKTVEIRSTSGTINASELSGKTVKVSSNSGEIEMDNINAEDVSLKSTSGNLIIGNVTASGELNMSTSSGNCEVTRIDGNKVIKESTSGSTRIKDASVNNLKCSSASGDAEIGMNGGSAEVTSTSGEIRVWFEDDFEEFSASASSGNVTLEIPEDSEFSMDISTNSGDIDCNDFSMKINSSKRDRLKAEVGNGGSKVKISTTSGNARIKKR